MAMIDEAYVFQPKPANLHQVLTERLKQTPTDQALRAALAAHHPNGSYSFDAVDACAGCGTEGPCKDWVTEHIDDCPVLLDQARRTA